jgi:hypothetical protein
MRIAESLTNGMSMKTLTIARTTSAKETMNPKRIRNPPGHIHPVNGISRHPAEATPARWR